MSSPKSQITPLIIIHGGAGNLTKKTLPRDLYDAYRTSLTRIITQSLSDLYTGSSALTVATHAVSLLENDPLYNSGKGAVFTRSGTNELECSVMVSDGQRKRGVTCSMLTRVRNPILLAREVLVREEVRVGDHVQFSGEYVEGLAEGWGLDVVGPEYFFTQRRWDEHVRGLKEEEEEGGGGFEKDRYVPLGTCGAVVVDENGTVCVATSTGGLTNKVPGRIGDTPSMGAGFWAEEWMERGMVYRPMEGVMSPVEKLSRGDLRGLVGDCLPGIGALGLSTATQATTQVDEKAGGVRHAVGISGTGNGDSFLRLCAARTAAAYSRFSHTSLSTATSWMAGRGGELQQSAGDRWGKTNEGTGGMIGIEVVGDRANVVYDFNCGGMFRAWVDDEWNVKCLIFREDSWESGPESWDDV
ncbi:nucleophile aminohydrolase [Phaeosphaeriaceae sp. PMI808]|nr:nucleophile aminohydrolase [Phaeosphaeriaceae sp. PMI808]